jgi:lipopolysaccharide export system protein LptC
MNFVRRLLDQLGVYLPLLVMAVLALGSWWLVKSVPVLRSPAANKPIRVEPDYRLANFSAKTFDHTGRMTREVTGVQAQHFPATETLHIDQVRVYARTEGGADIHAQALKGIASDDGKTVTLMGEAYALRDPFENQPQMELSGERLVALPDEDRVLSASPVRITRGRDVFTANTMDFNSSSGQHRLQGRVRATLQPQPRH